MDNKLTTVESSHALHLFCAFLVAVHHFSVQTNIKCDDIQII